MAAFLIGKAGTLNKSGSIQGQIWEGEFCDPHYLICSYFAITGVSNPLHLFFQGAAFGFNVIATRAGEQLAPFLPQLVPRLYRYQFDPNLGIRQAMTSIWNALVTDKATASI